MNNTRIFHGKLNQEKIVLEQISLVEEQILIHHDVVARLSQNQLSQDQFCATSQKGDVGFDGSRDHPDQRLPKEKVSERDQTLSRRDPPSPLMHTCYPSSDPKVSTTSGGQSNAVPSKEDIARNPTQQVTPRPASDTGKESRLHISEFIQSLSE
jgi:hypothetical protein